MATLLQRIQASRRAHSKPRPSLLKATADRNIASLSIPTRYFSKVHCGGAPQGYEQLHLRKLVRALPGKGILRWSPRIASRVLHIALTCDSRAVAAQQGRCPATADVLVLLRSLSVQTSVTGRPSVLPERLQLPVRHTCVQGAQIPGRPVSLALFTLRAMCQICRLMHLLHC